MNDNWTLIREMNKFTLLTTCCCFICICLNEATSLHRTSFSLDTQKLCRNIVNKCYNNHLWPLNRSTHVSQHSQLRWWWWWLLICIAHYAKRLYCAMCPGALWKGMSSMMIEKMRRWAMGHGDDQAACSRPSDQPRRMSDVRTYYNDFTGSLDPENMGVATEITFLSALVLKL